MIIKKDYRITDLDKNMNTNIQNKSCLGKTMFIYNKQQGKSNIK